MSIELSKTPLRPAWATDAERVLVHGGESATLGTGGTVSLPGGDDGGSGGSGSSSPRSGRGGRGCGSCVSYLRVHSPCLLDDDGDVHPVPFEHDASLFSPSTQRRLAFTVELVAEPIFAAEVVRRVSDFKWLADTLGNEHCGACIPPLPLACLAGLQGLQAGAGAAAGGGGATVSAHSSALASLVLAECSDREGGRGPAAAYGVLLACSQRALHRFLGCVLRHRVLGQSPHLWLFLEEQAYCGMGSWTEYTQGVDGRAKDGLGAATAAAVGAALAPFGAGLRDVSDAIAERSLAIGSFFKGLGVEGGSPPAPTAAAAAAATTVASSASNSAGSLSAAETHDNARSNSGSSIPSGTACPVTRAASGPETAKVGQEWWGPVVPKHCASADDALAERLGRRLHEMHSALGSLRQAVAALGGGTAVCGGRAVAAALREVAEVAGLLVAPEVVASVQAESDACAAAEKSLLSGSPSVWREERGAAEEAAMSSATAAATAAVGAAITGPAQQRLLLAQAYAADPPSAAGAGASGDISRAASPGVPVEGTAALHIDCSFGEVLAPLAAGLGEQQQGRFDELAEQLDDEMGTIIAMRHALAARQLRRVAVYRARRALIRAVDREQGRTAPSATAVADSVGAADLGASAAVTETMTALAAGKVPAVTSDAAESCGAPAARRALTTAEAALDAVQAVAFCDALEHQASAAPRLKALFTSFIARERAALEQRRTALGRAAVSLDDADADAVSAGARAAAAARAKLLSAATVSASGGSPRFVRPSPGKVLVTKRSKNDNEPGSPLSPNSPSWLTGANSSTGAAVAASARSSDLTGNSTFGGDFLYGSSAPDRNMTSHTNQPIGKTANFPPTLQKGSFVANFGEGAIGLSFRSIGEFAASKWYLHGPCVSRTNTVLIFIRTNTALSLSLCRP